MNDIPPRIRREIVRIASEITIGSGDASKVSANAAPLLAWVLEATDDEDATARFHALYRQATNLEFDAVRASKRLFEVDADVTQPQYYYDMPDRLLTQARILYELVTAARPAPGSECDHNPLCGEPLVPISNDHMLEELPESPRSSISDFQRICNALSAISSNLYQEDGLTQMYDPQWTLDQVIRALTGCPSTLSRCGDRIFEGSEEYEQFVSPFPGWSSGARPPWAQG
jgi:hypothetical protein